MVGKEIYSRGGRSAMKQFLHMVAYDMRFSFRKNRYKWLVAIGIFLFWSLQIFRQIASVVGVYDFFSEIWPVMCGEREYILMNDSTFQLPAYWMLFHGYLFFLIGFYPVSDLYHGNGQTCIRAKSRRAWMFSKQISIFLNIVLYYVFFLILLWIGNAFYHGTLLPESGVLSLSGLRVLNKSISELVVAFIILPFLVSWALVEIQIVLSFMISPVLAFMFMVGYLIASVFWMQPYWIGNFAMIYRQGWVSGRADLSVNTGIQICVVLIVLSYMLGIFLFERKDILTEE